MLQYKVNSDFIHGIIFGAHGFYIFEYQLVWISYRKLSHLPEEEKTVYVIKQLVEDFVGLFPDIPGKTIAAHDDIDIDVGDAHIIKQHLNQMNPTKLAAVRQEVEYMLQNDIIKQTQNHWSSLYVLVPKRNDS